MFYRRKILLATIQIFGDHIEKISLHKLLFLLAQKQEKPIYDFVPYRFGSYSFSANSDLTVLARNNKLSEDEKSFTKTDKTDYLSSLTMDDRLLLSKLKIEYGDFASRDLVKHTYLAYPYYAINSEIAADVLSKDDFEKVIEARPSVKTTTLFTIGYEGISIEKFLNRLIQNSIKALIDVRNNPLSMKYGFSKTRLRAFCGNLGINYLHIPELGIDSKFRQGLSSQTKYDELFDSYKRNTLNNMIESQQEILAQLVSNKRIALMCFEADLQKCHRVPLANAISKLSEDKLKPKHI